MQYSNRYTVLYALGFTAIVALVLAVSATALKPLQEANEAFAKKRAILSSMQAVNPETLEADYAQYITEFVLNADGNPVDGVVAFDLDVAKEMKKAAEERQLPLYLYQNNEAAYPIIPVTGSGLWGPISAFVALEEDYNTIKAIVFDHEKETPGLGAEIKTTWFQDQFEGKKLFEDNAFRSILVLRGRGNNITGRPHHVDGISGATITANGVTDMLADGLRNYIPYFQQQQNDSPTDG